MNTTPMHSSSTRTTAGHRPWLGRVVLLLALSAAGCASQPGLRPSLDLYLPYAAFRAAVQSQTPLCVGKSSSTADACGGQQTPPTAVPPLTLTDPRVRWVVCGVGDRITPKTVTCVNIIEDATSY